MAYTRPWRDFRRMQSLTLAAAGLIHLAATIHALGRLSGPAVGLLTWTVLWPVVFFVTAFILPLAIGPVRRWLAAYVWMSFQAGYGQRVRSVIPAMALLAGAAVFLYGQIDAALAAGGYRVGAFSAYGAGVGVLAAQAVLVRMIEKLPQVKARIEAPT